MNVPRYRILHALDPDADPTCRLEPKRGRRHKANTGRLFAQLVDQHATPTGQEFIFRGDCDQLWRDVTAFVDEEAECCPFFTFEQVERADGVMLRVSGKAAQRQETG